jgi:hypothetical protein
MDVEAFKRSLPRNLENRFTSLSAYVRSIIEVEQQNNRDFPRLSENQISLIQLVVFVYSLDSFFRLGTVAAQNASNIFSQYEISGFRIGQKSFTARNENTMLGEHLANNLRSSIIDTGFSKYIQNATSIRDLILSINRDLTHD